MGGWDSCCVAGWLLPFVFSFAIPVGVARVVGVVAALLAHWSPLLFCTRYTLKSLQGSMPDIKCETDINIFHCSFFRKLYIFEL